MKKVASRCHVGRYGPVFDDTEFPFAVLDEGITVRTLVSERDGDAGFYGVTFTVAVDGPVTHDDEAVCIESRSYSERRNGS